MDAITAAALSVDNPAIHAAGMFLNDFTAYAGAIVALALLGERRDGKRVKLILSLILAGILVTAVKNGMERERPCLGETGCPTTYSFPSMHAAIAFTLMTGFLNKKTYPLYLAFALFVSFTRMNLGVHIFQDIAGALPLALVSYYIVDIFWKPPGGGSDEA